MGDRALRGQRYLDIPWVVATVYGKDTNYLRLLEDFFSKLAIHKWTNTHVFEIIT